MSVQGERTVYPPIFIQLDAPPEGTRLERAYPNPFNPRTHITYRLAEAAQVKITVFNLAGREIKELHNGRQPAGSYLITWNGTNANGQNVSSGAYVIRMQTETETEVQKVMLLK
jgi:hypothetical protein